MRVRTFPPVLVLTVIAAGPFTAAVARAQEAPPEQQRKEERGRSPLEQGIRQALLIGKARETLAKTRHCIRSEEPLLLDTACAIRTYHEAGEYLRDGGVDPEREPRLWWSIYEGLGLAFAQRQNFEKARQFFLEAGRIHGAGPDTREESLYNLAAADWWLGEEQGALQRFDQLFERDPEWLERAKNDPALRGMRRTKAWQKLLEKHSGGKAPSTGK